MHSSGARRAAGEGRHALVQLHPAAGDKGVQVAAGAGAGADAGREVQVPRIQDEFQGTRSEINTEDL